MSKQQITLLASVAPWRLVVLSVLTLASLLLAACDISPASSGTAPTATTARATATATPLPLPTSVTVLRFGGESDQNHVAPFLRTSQDAASVQRLYNAVFALPPPPQIFSCPQGLVIGYQLSFMHGDTLVLQVLLSGACPVVSISHPRECRAWTHTLDAQLAATLGVPETTLVPLSSLVNTAGPAGPFAPYGPTPPILTNSLCGDQFPTG